MMHAKHIQNQGQTGMVSILVTVIIMMVLGLITIGFARLALREQRQSLDRQLSTGAFYAAESGVNDAIKALKAGLDVTKDYTTCNDPALVSPNANQLDGTNVQYTCLLVDPSPPTLIGTIDTNASTVFPITAKSGTITSLTIMWQDTTGNKGTSCTFPLGSFPVANGASGWPSGCNAGMLRFDLVPGTSFTRAGLATNVMSAFLQPIGAAGNATALAYASGGSALPIAAGNCNNTNVANLCKAFITNLNASTYYLRLRSVYKPNTITICINNSTSDCSTATTEIIGSQAVVDSTGKDVDVLRRISVRVPITTIFANNGDVPDFAIGSKDNICKRFAAYPGGATDQATPACSF
jgi:Tfp pilus assembly protein PilX